MSYPRVIVIAALAAATLGRGPAASAQTPLREQLVGTWMLVSSERTRADGTMYLPYGAHPSGTLMFQRNGRFAAILINSNVPKYASNSREQPTPEEALAAAKGTNAFFGTYSVDENARTFVFHIDSSSNYPNANGANQMRMIRDLTDTTLVYFNADPPNSGALAVLTWRRV